ncbi:MAG: amino acid carrier protein [Chlamydiae bacterium]|nr:amino acid carrier protein [Chlamydiota bacterium]
MAVLDFFSHINRAFTLFFVLPGILVLGLYLSIKLNFLQVSKLLLSARRLVIKDQGGKEGISQYQALSTVIAGNLGTGNISGMAIALTTGGPGALVWMWIMAFFGSTIQYASCVLGVKYRQQNKDGELVGGPMYYLHQGLGFKKIAAIFSFFTLIAALTVGNFAQINSIILPIGSLGINPLVCGMVMMVIVGGVTLGGIGRLAKVASSVVPFMAILYLLGAVTVLAFYHQNIIPAFAQMLSSAFSGSALAGGVLGFGAFKALQVGFERGVFATDAGTGIAPILQASARTEHPVVDGLVTLVAPLIVMVVCTTTGLVLLVTGAYQQDGLQSTNMVTYAFSQVFGFKIGSLMVITALSFFAYTTVIAWGFCGEKAASFLWGKTRARWFQYLYLLLIPVGAVARVELVWVLADLSISLMLLTNLIGVAGLSSEVIGETRSYFARDKSQQLIKR